MSAKGASFQRGPKTGYPRNFFGFSFLKISFPGFIVIQTGYWPDSKFESISIIKNIFVMKNVTDFRKTVETIVDPRLIFCHRLTRSTSKLDFLFSNFDFGALYSQ